MSLLGVLALLVGGLTLTSAIVVILSKHPLYAVIYLFLACVGVACEFVLLGAYFLAVVQFLLTAGSATVMFIFLMLVTRRKERFHVVEITVPVVMMVVMLGCVFLASGVKGSTHLADPSMGLPGVAFSPSAVGTKASALHRDAGSIYQMGASLVGEHLLTLEILSVMMLLSIVALVVFLRVPRQKDEHSTLDGG